MTVEYEQLTIMVIAVAKRFKLKGVCKRCGDQKWKLPMTI
jgi:hypothetical protein